MFEKSLAGIGVGSQSLENDKNIEFVARYDIYYDCPNGHTIIVPMSENAQIPPHWECYCSAIAPLRDASKKINRRKRSAKTHWDMIKERRSETELHENYKQICDEIQKGTYRRIRK